MNKPNTKTQKLFEVLSVVIVIIIWQLTANRWSFLSFFPSPSAILKELFSLIITLETYRILGTTLLRLLFSLCISTVFGTFLGLFSGLHYQVESLLKPIVVTLRTIPIISIVVIILMLYGNVASLYIIIFLVLFPIIYQAQLDGIKNIDREYLEVLKMDCDRCSFPAVRMVFFPMALPHLRTGILQSIGLGIKVLVMAEFIAQTKVGIGREFIKQRLILNFANIIAWTLILVLIALIVEHYINKYLKYTKV